MPNRIVREGILASERVDRIADEPATEVFYRRLHSVADDYGRFSAHPSLLRAALYPLRLDRVTDTEISGHMQACASAGLIRLYQVAGKAYLEVTDFRQKMRAKKSKWPAPDTHTPDVCVPRDLHVMDTCGPRVVHMRTESEARGENREAEARADGAMPLDAFFEERYARHPKKRDRTLAEHALVGIAGIETRQKQDEFRAGHEAWLATDDYQWKAGTKAPTFAEFITDRTWQYPPSKPSDGDGGGSLIDRAIADWRRGADKEAA